MESKRQKQLASDIQRIIGKAFQQDLREHLKGAFVTVSNVSVTPDLLIARVNVSVLQKEKEKEVVESLQQNSNIARGVVGHQLQNKVRRIPEIEFYLDQSLEKVFEIEQLLKESKQESKEEE